jgi:hypothetical protein
MELLTHSSSCPQNIAAVLMSLHPGKHLFEEVPPERALRAEAQLMGR